MAKFIILYVKDDEVAEDFIEVAPSRSGGRVVGVYEDPKGKARTCVCGGQGNKTGSGGYSADHTYGWMMHRACSGVVKHWRRDWGKRLFHIFGVNRLPRSKTPKSFRNPMGWGPE